ncbi:hypothetical protein I6U48_10435 [Clostridium sp. PL3]|uniref:Uncharacterized protein n=1 Tax=Clostridium thailandense TaxID=2794346 RepID=A0A949TXE9_9CLOT|nr:hypothetical protein [Clostridium thailandense]MBV7273325.1 hypothetical protein [Clostridium thailandense]
MSDENIKIVHDNKIKSCVRIFETKEELFELFSDEFMKKYTNLDSFEAFTFSGAVFIDWQAKVIMGSREAFDCCVKGKTQFNTWEEMYRKAVQFRSNLD